MWNEQATNLVDKKKEEAIAICTCGLEHQMNYVPAFEAIDYYNKLIPKFKTK